MRTQAAGRRAAAFTLVEMLAVIAIIAVLAGLLVPTVIAVRNKIKEGATKSEVFSLRMAMEAYYTDWATYPPDRKIWASGAYDSSECLVYYLNTIFRTSYGHTRNTNVYFNFAAERLVLTDAANNRGYDNDGDGNFDEDPVDGVNNDGDGLIDEDPKDYRYLDLLGARNCSCALGNVWFYRFDNNEADNGDQTNWSPATDATVWDLAPYNGLTRNYTNVLRTKVDVWSAGWNAEDPVHQCTGHNPYHPTADNVTRLPETYTPASNYPKFDDIGF